MPEIQLSKGYITFVDDDRQRISKSGYRGVYPNGKRWECQLKSKYYGLFDTKEEAARKFDELALKEFGEFATLNFPISGPRASAVA